MVEEERTKKECAHMHTRENAFIFRQTAAGKVLPVDFFILRVPGKKIVFQMRHMRQEILEQTGFKEEGDNIHQMKWLFYAKA